MSFIDIPTAVARLKQGGIIAYPTEAVFGLGCDPFNEKAVNRLLAAKQREITKGLILIAASFADVTALTQPLPQARLAEVLAHWPGPVSFAFPATVLVPRWICGDHNSVVLRITAHPIAHALSLACGGPLVSTSANIASKPPARTANEVQANLGGLIDGIIDGAVGDLTKPTVIRDALTGAVIRA